MGFERKDWCDIHNCKRRLRLINADKGWHRSECPECARARKHKCYLKRRAAHPDWTGYLRVIKRRYRARLKGQACRRWLSHATTLQRLVVGRWA